MKKLREALGQDVAQRRLHEMARAQIKKYLMRETPGDAQYVELLGSMSFMRENGLVDIYVPVVLKAPNFPGNVEEFESATEHLLTIDSEDYDVSWRPAARDIGDRGGPSVRAEWYVVAVENMRLEREDSDRLTAYLKSRPEIAEEITEKVNDALEAEAEDEGPPEDDWEDS